MRLVHVSTDSEISCPSQTLSGRRSLFTIPPRRILLVDSSDLLVDSEPSDCAERGWQLVRAVNALEAYQEATRQPIDLAIIAIDLPDESGWLVAAKLKLRTHPPQIWLVGNEFDRQAAELASEIGADQYRTRQELPVCLAEVFSKRQ